MDAVSWAARGPERLDSPPGALVPLRSELAAGSRESILDGRARLVKERGIAVE